MRHEPGALLRSEGEIVRDDAVFRDYAEMRSLPMRALRLWPAREWSIDTLVSFAADDVLLTNWFIPVDLARRRMFFNQTYAQAARDFPMRFRFGDGRYALESQPLACSGRYVVVGGPVDGAWYHWLFNWCPRLLLLRVLHPELFDRPDLRFVVHPLALREPFRSVLDTFGIAADRLFAVDPAKDYRLETAHLVSFLDEEKLFPDLIRSFRTHLVRAWGLEEVPRHGGVFASRQALAAPKRRIANFSEIEPVLAQASLTVASLGDMPAVEQARLFRGAELVVGAHGSDLSNLLFCRPGTPVVVIESQYSIDMSLHVGLKYLCEALGLTYEFLITPVIGQPGPEAPASRWIDRDYRVDPGFLADALRHATARDGLTYAALSRGEGEAFVETCYRRLLGKQADAAGMAHYLHRLYGEGASKRDVIAELLRTPDGVARGAVVRGLDDGAEP